MMRPSGKLLEEFDRKQRQQPLVDLLVIALAFIAALVVIAVWR